MGKNFKKFLSFNIDYVDYLLKWEKKMGKHKCQKLNNILHFNFMNI
jgi:hypothetical protein